MRNFNLFSKSGQGEREKSSIFRRVASKICSGFSHPNTLSLVSRQSDLTIYGALRRVAVALLLLTLTAFAGVGQAWGETIYSETFGTSGNNTAWSSYSGWSDSFTSKHASTTSWKVSKPGSSPCGLTGSSGSCNAYLGSSSGDLIIHFGDISSYSDIVLTFNYINDASATKNRTFECAVSSDGGKTWSSNVLPNSKSQAWTAASYSVTTTNAANFSVKFRNTATNLSRIDDVKLTGTAAPPTKCATPALSLDAGTYTGSQSVTLSCSTTDATIRYTTDGSTPTSTSTMYSSAISVEQTTTIKAKAFKDGLTASDEASATYTIKCATPTFTKSTGTYNNDFTVELSTTFGTSIYYTTDNSAPTTSSTLYSGGAINVNATQTIKAIAVKDNCENSAVASVVYTLKCATPTFSATGTYAQNVEISSTTTNAVIRYTLDGSDPTETSDVYSTAINIPVTKTLRARAFKTGYTKSDARQTTYTIECAQPTASLAAGTYAGPQDITLSTEYGDAIYYTTSTTSSAAASPSPGSVGTTLYTGPIHITTTTKIKAIATKDGCTDSNILGGSSTYLYTIQYNVSWMVNGAEWSGKGGSATVNGGSHITTLPTAPTTGDFCGDRFMGWTDATDGNYVYGTSNLYTTASGFPNATGDQVFYAVFADYVEK